MLLASDTKRTTAETYVKSPSFCLMNKPIEACSGGVKFHQNDQKFLAPKINWNYFIRHDLAREAQK